MDACRYCREYHAPFMVCEGYIKALTEGKVKPTKKKVKE